MFYNSCFNDFIVGGFLGVRSIARGGFVLFLLCGGFLSGFFGLGRVLTSARGKPRT